MKKLLSIIIAVAMLLSVCTFAFAAQTQATRAEAPKNAVRTDGPKTVAPRANATEVNVQRAEAAKVEAPQVLKDKLADFKGLKDQSQQLRASLKEVSDSIKGVLRAKRDEVNNVRKDNPLKIKTHHDEFKTELSALLTPLKDLREQLAQAIKENDSEKVAELKTQIEQAKQQIEAKKAELGKLREDIQQEKDLVKAQRDEIATIKEQLKPYQDQAQSITNELKSQKEAMGGYNSDLKSSMQAKDFTKACDTLDSMISLNQQINANLQKLIDVKNSIKSILGV